MGALIDLTGSKFGRLTVVGRASNGEYPVRWECDCECGAKVFVPSQRLRGGQTKSCGCWNKELTAARNRTHGKTREFLKELRAWLNMIDRCSNPSHKSYSNYGGRGINVCSEWKDSFERFLADMGKCPEGFSLDRINNEIGYSKTNCRWAGRKTQQNNRGNTLFLCVHGVEKSLSEWSKATGVSKDKIRYRLKKGMSHEDCVR